MLRAKTRAKLAQTKQTKRTKAPKAVAPVPTDDRAGWAPKRVRFMLRTCLADMRSPAREAEGFRWPESGLVEAKDWKPMKQCGGGLHGYLWGEGDAQSIVWD